MAFTGLVQFKADSGSDLGSDCMPFSNPIHEESTEVQYLQIKNLVEAAVR